MTTPRATGAEASPTPEAILIILRSRRNTVPLLTAYSSAVILITQYSAARIPKAG